jgi:hypothetical protein
MQETYAEGVLDGKSKSQAARDAGTTPAAVERFNTSAAVQAHLAQQRAAIQDATMLKRVDILDGILEAIERAKLMAEPATEIKGWVEISKILGFQEPEVKRKQLSTNATMLQDRLLHMSTADLLELAAGNMAPLEGEFRVETD